jgi:serine/threonine-protein kinase
MLNRDVAIKVLRADLVDDTDHLARFSREAQLLGALNHPNIAQLHGLEETSGHHALVMELVDGPTLADRLTAGALALDDALPTARQIVEALEAAHAAGIVHRDLKPANIKLRADGTVKVLDFGLAKALGRDADGGTSATSSPTISMHATAAGIILGTAAYMSPEQARGRPVDKRADIWAFGAVLYEMLTGRRAFDSDDTSDTLAFVLTKEPDWAALPAATPAVIRRLLRRCLAKDPKRRLPDISVARLDIDEALSGPATDAATGNAAGAARTGHWLVPFALGAVIAAVAAAGAWLASRPSPVSLPVTRFGITLPPDQPLAISFNDRDLAISPDGMHLVYTTGRDAELMIRALESQHPRHRRRPNPGAREHYAAEHRRQLCDFAARYAGVRHHRRCRRHPVAGVDRSAGQGGDHSRPSASVLPAAALSGRNSRCDGGQRRARIRVLDLALFASAADPIAIRPIRDLFGLVS